MHRIDGRGCEATYRLAPWDRAALPGASALLEGLCLRNPALAARDLVPFQEWCRDEGVVLATARLDHARLAEAGFLEGQGFRFIELNHRPFVGGLHRFLPDPAIKVRRAGRGDAAPIAAIAATIFEAGRFHLDPLIGPEIGNCRYALWAARAFNNTAQQVLACELDGALAAFLVVESPRADARFWSLVGVAPGLAGRRIGRRIWNSVLAWHAAENVTEVATSISSHNAAAHNLYVSLGFRFPAPSMLLHWCPAGPLSPKMPGGAE